MSTTRLVKNAFLTSILQWALYSLFSDARDCTQRRMYVDAFCPRIYGAPATNSTFKISLALEKMSLAFLPNLSFRTTELL